MIRLRRGKCHPCGGTPRREFGEKGPCGRDLGRQLPVLGRIDDIGAASQHGDGRSAAPQRAPVGGGVHASRQTAHHAETRAGQALRQLEPDLEAVRCREPRPDDGHLEAAWSGVAAGPEDGRRVRNLPQVARVGGAVARDDVDASFPGLLERGLGAAAEVRGPCSGRRHLQQRQHLVEVVERPRVGAGDIRGIRIGRRRMPEGFPSGPFGPEQGEGDQVELAAHGQVRMRSAYQLLAHRRAGGYSGISPACR